MPQEDYDNARQIAVKFTDGTVRKFPSEAGLMDWANATEEEGGLTIYTEGRTEWFHMSRVAAWTRVENKPLRKCVCPSCFGTRLALWPQEGPDAGMYRATCETCGHAAGLVSVDTVRECWPLEMLTPRQREPRKVECKRCGYPFHPEHDEQVYCSASCQWKTRGTI